MVKSFLVREPLSFLRGYGAGRRGQGNERNAAARHLRGRCAANVPHRPAFAKARRFSRRPARRPRRGLESLGRVRPRPPQFTPNQIALRLQRTLMCGGSEAVERKSERMDTAYSPRLHEEELSAAASRILWGQPMATINQFFLCDLCVLCG